MTQTQVTDSGMYARVETLSSEDLTEIWIKTNGLNRPLETARIFAFARAVYARAAIAHSETRELEEVINTRMVAWQKSQESGWLNAILSDLSQHTDSVRMDWVSVDDRLPNDLFCVERLGMRDDDGFITHPDLELIYQLLGIHDEGEAEVSFIKSLGYEYKNISMEVYAPDLADKYFELGEANCSYWEPVKPDGQGWLLISIHDTEDAPFALYVRKLHAEVTPLPNTPIVNRDLDDPLGR